MTKVPVTMFVDPAVETALTIKPFAAGLAKKSHAAALPEGVCGTVTGTNVTGHADVDADVDYVGGDDSDGS